MIRLLVLLTALLAVAPAGTALAGYCCQADPGGIDLDPTEAPLLVTRTPSELVLSWESPFRADTEVFEGDLDLLWSDERLSEFSIADTPESEFRTPMPVTNRYFLISGSCHGFVCTRGRNSFGNDRGDPWCEILERGDLYNDAATCLRGGEGIVRDMVEYDAFAACFTFNQPPAPPAPGEALVWRTDHASSACGTCLEFTCASGIGGELLVEHAGGPWGDCDAIHDGGAWARVPNAPIITIQGSDPLPEEGPCN